MHVHQPHAERTVALEVLCGELHRNTRWDIRVEERLGVSAFEIKPWLRQVVSEQRRLVYLVAAAIEGDHHVIEGSGPTRAAQRRKPVSGIAKRCGRYGNKYGAVVEAVRICRGRT